ncbi:MAG: MFS transporter [Bacillota bacterium]
MMKDEKKYSLGSKFGYATGDVLGGGAFSLISLLFLAFLVTVEGIPATLAGFVVMAGKIWDAVSDPMMGVISDRTKSKMGRRRPYFLLGIIPVLVTFAMLWYSFGISSVGGKVAYYIFAYIMFSTAFTIVMTPYNALLPDMVDSYSERTGFSTIRMLVSNISAAISVILPPILISAGVSYVVMGLIFGAFYAFPLIITFKTTWENDCPESDMKFADLFKQLAVSFKNKTYRQYLGIFIYGQMATDVTSTMLIFWLTDVLIRSGMMSVLTAITMVVAICFLPVNNIIAKKIGKHMPAIYWQPLKIATCIIAFFFGASTPTIALVLICIVGGVGGGASSFVPWSLLPDLPDTDEMINGSKNAGIYAGMSTFIRKSTSGVAIFIVGVVMDLFGYVESTGDIVVVQTAEVLLGVRVLYCLVPALLALLTFFFAFRYRLTKENYVLIKKAIDHKKETGTAVSDPELITACEYVSGMSIDKLWVGRSEVISKE